MKYTISVGALNIVHEYDDAEQARSKYEEYVVISRDTDSNMVNRPSTDDAILAQLLAGEVITLTATGEYYTVKTTPNDPSIPGYAGYNTVVIYEGAEEIDVFTRVDAQGCIHDPGKFEREHWSARILYQSAMNSNADEETGDSSDGIGYFWKFAFTGDAQQYGLDSNVLGVVLSESLSGFIGVTQYINQDDFDTEWSRIEEETTPDDDIEHCEQCGEQLEPGQIGLCDDCQDEEGDN